MRELQGHDDAATTVRKIAFAEAEARRGAVMNLGSGNTAASLPPAAAAVPSSDPVTALLIERGAQLRDETGWKLSTTHAAAQLMAALHACAPRASTDEVLDWLKGAPRWRGACLGWAALHILLALPLNRLLKSLP